MIVTCNEMDAEIVRELTQARRAFAAGNNTEGFAQLRCFEDALRDGGLPEISLSMMHEQVEDIRGCVN